MSIHALAIVALLAICEASVIPVSSAWHQTPVCGARVPPCRRSDCSSVKYLPLDFNQALSLFQPESPFSDLQLNIIDSQGNAIDISNLFECTGSSRYDCWPFEAELPCRRDVPCGGIQCCAGCVCGRRVPSGFNSVCCRGPLCPGCNVCREVRCPNVDCCRPSRRVCCKCTKVNNCPPCVRPVCTL